MDMYAGVPSATPVFVIGECKSASPTSFEIPMMASLHDASGWSPVSLSNGIEILPRSYLAGDANVAGKALIVWSQKTTLADGSPGGAIYHAQYIRERGWSQAGLVTESPNNLLVGWVVLRENGTGTVVIMSSVPGSSEQDLLSVTSK
jgi:hypothetical protein